MKKIFLSIIALCALAAGTVQAQQRRHILWFDATANFKRFAFRDSVSYYLDKSKEAGITDVVVDVKPISGEVLYASRIAPEMKEWDGFTKPGGFDLLQAFIEEGHKRGLKVHASTNVFVAGHNHLNRGVVYQDAAKKEWQTISLLPKGLTPITEQKNKYSAMLNPARKDVQAYELSILSELVRKYPQMDGIILDRVRYDGIQADFSDYSRKAFEKYAGKKVASFPADIYSYNDKGERVEGPLFKQWLEWRTSVISNFMASARKTLKKINPRLIFGDYTGSWYPTYYEVGVNWASSDYDPSQDYPWATAGYKKYGYAAMLDLFTTGNYYFEVNRSEAHAIDTATVNRGEAGQGRGKDEFYTVEGSADLVNKVVKGAAPVYAGLYVDQYKDHPGQFVKALKMCRSKSQGAMIFDIVHIINWNWWNELKAGLQD